jgi:hypothetical protein
MTTPLRVLLLLLCWLAGCITTLPVAAPATLDVRW